MHGSRIFSGGSTPGGQKTVWTLLFFFLVFFFLVSCFFFVFFGFLLLFFCLQLILQFTEGSNGFITVKTILFQGS